MDARQFTDQFIKSDFASKNLFSHLQMGIPLPMLRHDELCLKLLFHKMRCGEDGIVLSAPRFEVCLAYPSGRIVRFLEIEDAESQTNEVQVPQKKLRSFQNFYERSFSACDEILSFYEQHRSVTDILFRRYHSHVAELAAGIGMAQWYGGSL